MDKAPLHLDVRSVASLFDAVDLGVLAVSDGRVVYANQRAREWFAEAVLIDAAVSALFGGAAVEDDGAGGRFLRVHDGHDGERLIGFSHYAASAPHPLDWYFLRDITERVWVRRSSESLAQMNSLGFLLAGITHELGNPIHGVLMASALLLERRDAQRPEDRDGYLREIHDAAVRMKEILRLMQSFVRADAISIAPTDLRAVCRGTVALVRRTGRSDPRPPVPLVTPFEDRDGPVLALVDAAAFRQALLNLLANAFDAFAAGEERAGRSSTPPREAPPLVRIDLWSASGRVHVVVEDNGRGMTATQLQRLFVPFASSKVAGTGFGLVIVKKLVTLMGGTIDVRSDPSWGTKFEMTFPSAPRQEDR